MGAGSDENSDVDSAGVYFVSVEEFEQRELSGCGSVPLSACGPEALAEYGAEPSANRRPIKTLQKPN
jgi:hypothetical protein